MCKRIFRKSLRFARYQIRKGTALLRLLIRRKAPAARRDDGEDAEGPWGFLSCCED